ncbi:hypothetical protein Tco_1159646, partial [Tanacetum coccineum]
MHNNIMAAGSKDHLPMLGPERYLQWRSRFLRYIDTKPNGEGLRKSILSGPYVPSTVLVQAVAATEGNPAIQQHTTIETIIYIPLLMLVKQRMRQIAIERLHQGESLNVQDVKTNLFWEFGKFTSRDGESMKSYYSRFYKLMNELTRNNLQVTTMQQYQNEVNDIRAERIAKSANPLALLAAAQPYSDNYYQAPKPQRSNATSSSTRPMIMNKVLKRGYGYAKEFALLGQSTFQLYKPTNNNLRTSSNSRNKTEDTTPRYNNDNQSGQFGNQRTMTVVVTRETVGSLVVQQTGIQCFNYKGFGHYAKESKKPKRVKDYTYHKENMMMCKQAEQGVLLQAKQADWLADTDEEIDEQELEAHYSFMA